MIFIIKFIIIFENEGIKIYYYLVCNDFGVLVCGVCLMVIIWYFCKGRKVYIFYYRGLVGIYL